jgi:hypothetical protein
MTGSPPPYLEVVHVRDRMYPAAWRDAAVRALYDPAIGGIVCPGCDLRFTERARLRELQADHIHAYSRGGETTWANLQLLCGRCNLQKSDRPHILQILQKANPR